MNIQKYKLVVKKILAKRVEKRLNIQQKTFYSTFFLLK